VHESNAQTSYLLTYLLYYWWVYEVVNIRVWLTAAETPDTCPRNGHVTADVDPRTGKGHVIFGEPRTPTTASEGLPTRQSNTRHRTTSHPSSSIGVQSCPWTLRALPGISIELLYTHTHHFRKNSRGANSSRGANPTLNTPQSQYAVDYCMYTASYKSKNVFCLIRIAILDQQWLLLLQDFGILGYTKWPTSRLPVSTSLHAEPAPHHSAVTVARPSIQYLV